MTNTKGKQLIEACSEGRIEIVQKLIETRVQILT
jgi:hypothetical protein